MRVTAMYLANRRLALTRQAARERSVQVSAAGQPSGEAGADSNAGLAPLR